MESGLIFNQLICEFESRHPYHDMVEVAGINSSDLILSCGSASQGSDK